MQGGVGYGWSHNMTITLSLFTWLIVMWGREGLLFLLELQVACDKPNSDIEGDSL